MALGGREVGRGSPPSPNARHRRYPASGGGPFPPSPVSIMCKPSLGQRDSIAGLSHAFAIRRRWVSVLPRTVHGSRDHAVGCPRVELRGKYDPVKNMANRKKAGPGCRVRQRLDLKNLRYTPPLSQARTSIKPRERRLERASRQDTEETARNQGFSCLETR